MIGFTFDKDKAHHFVTCIAEGGSIKHEGGWSADEMLMLAGACFFGVFSQGPSLQKVAKLMGKAVPQLHPEQAEAQEQQFCADIHGAIEFMSELAMRVYDDKYDERYEPVVQALLRGDTRQVHPLAGFKKAG